MSAITRGFLVGAMCLLVSACATIILSPEQELSISSNPSGATVTNSGQILGTTPLVADLKRNRNHNLQIELEGYHPYEVALSRSASGWIFGNIIFGGVIGLVIDAATGSMYVLSPDQIQAQLHRTDTSMRPRDGQAIIAVTMEADPSWTKIGQLERK